MTDTIGLRVGLEVRSAGIQDRDGAPDVLAAVAERSPMLRHIFAPFRQIAAQSPAGQWMAGMPAPNCETR